MNDITVNEHLADELAQFCSSHRRLFVLTGAGCSTASGIPDYRDGNGDWKRPRPVLYQDFIASAAVRRRYWARALIGWQRFATAIPNGAHHGLAALERAGRLTGLVTQNVDGLHTAAGQRRCIDLHGSLDRVVCLQCRRSTERRALQQQLAALNPALAGADAAMAPDGDADLDDSHLDGFRLIDCSNCGGALKPDVVFFGENVPRERYRRAGEWLAEADAMLVVGSSLMVFSGYRFAVDAARRGMPVAALNLGSTRADHLLRQHWRAPCEAALAALCARLSPSITSRPETRPIA